MWCHIVAYGSIDVSSVCVIGWSVLKLNLVMQINKWIFILFSLYFVWAKFSNFYTTIQTLQVSLSNKLINLLTSFFFISFSFLQLVNMLCIHNILRWKGCICKCNTNSNILLLSFFFFFLSKLRAQWYYKE